MRVRLGPNSTDEMAELGLQVLTKSLADAARIVQSFADREAQANVALGELRVKESPDNAEYQAFLGASYVDVDRYADAIPHLEAAIRLDERASGPHNDLATALMSQGRLPEALRQLQDKLLAGVPLPISGIGGIQDATDAIEFFLAGATTVQVGTQSFVDPDASGHIVRDLQARLAADGISDVRELVGALRV